jgi:WD40 repeat protein
VSRLIDPKRHAAASPYFLVPPLRTSFRDFAPDDGHAVVALSWSPSGDRLLTVTGGAQPQIFTREGKPLLRFVRGDMYVNDMVHTHGHVTMCTGGHWHPHEKMRVLTSSLDGSLRIWDLNGKTGLRDELQCDTVVRVRNARGLKAEATACAYAPDGGALYAGTNDGAVHAWGVKRGSAYARPDASTRATGAGAAARGASIGSGGFSGGGGGGAGGAGGHGPSAVVTCVLPSPDNRAVASRADDGSVCVWDVRKLKGPLVRYDVR